MSVRCVTPTQHRHSGLYACALVVRFLRRGEYHPTHTQAPQLLETWLMLAPKVFIIIVVIAVITSYYDHFYNFQQTCIASSSFRSFRNKGREVDSPWLDLLVCVCVRASARAHVPMKLCVFKEARGQLRCGSSGAVHLRVWVRLADQQAPSTLESPSSSATISSRHCHTWVFNVGSEARPQAFLILEKQALCERSHLLAHHCPLNPVSSIDPVLKTLCVGIPLSQSNRWPQSTHDGTGRRGVA